MAVVIARPGIKETWLRHWLYVSWFYSSFCFMKYCEAEYGFSSFPITQKRNLAVCCDEFAT